VQSASDVNAEAISCEQDIANQLLKAPYALYLFSLFDQVASARIKRWLACLFIHMYLGRHSWNIRSGSTLAWQVYTMYTEYHRELRHWGNSHEGHLTNVQERSNKSNNLGRSSLWELGRTRTSFLNANFSLSYHIIHLSYEKFLS